jgi:hypothetical protein
MQSFTTRLPTQNEVYQYLNQVCQAASSAINKAAISDAIDSSSRYIAEKIHDYIYQNRNYLFFGLSMLISAVSYPHVFSAGFAIGIVGGFLVSHAVKELLPTLDTYVCKKYCYEAGIALFTLAQVSAIAKICAYLNKHRINDLTFTSDGIIPTIVSGIIAGVFIQSALQLTYDECIGR